MAYALRPFMAGDAPALSRLTLEAIQVIGVKAYSPEQVRAWSESNFKPERFVARAEVGHLIFVIADETDAAAAYAVLEPDGHLDMLYCSPQHAGRGLAAQLLAHCEDQGRALNIPKLYTEASELARAAFERAGYTMTHRRDFAVHGVAIHNFAMEKLLA